MKKIFTFLFIFLCISTVTLFAQSRDGQSRYYSQDRNYSYNNNNYNDNNRDYNQNQSYNDRSYRETMDNRDMNKSELYDRDRNENHYSRNRVVYYRNYERSENLKAVGAGLIIGGLVALIAGSH